MFQLVGIDPSPFAQLFALDDAELASRGILRYVAEKPDCYPCRVSLKDADVGRELLLLSYQHMPASSPYRASGPIFVSRAAKAAVLPPGVVPPYVANRLISVRAYDGCHMMVSAEVVEGGALEEEILRMLSDDQVDYLHLHFARRGCFACAVRRC